MGGRPKGEFSASTLHSTILQGVDGSVAVESLHYSYDRSFNGFVANLTADEARKLAEREDVVSVFPNRKMQLQTTISWDFMDFSEQVKRSTLEGDIIVGVFDTGIRRNRKVSAMQTSVHLQKNGRENAKKSANFTCNKIIGARHDRSDSSSPEVPMRMVMGHKQPPSQPVPLLKARTC
ncbi:hypothetical protein SLA2020_037900 [Shorea laevis]